MIWQRPRTAERRRLRSFALATMITVGFGLPVVGYVHSVAQADTPDAKSEPSRDVMAQAVFRPAETTPAERARSILGIAAFVGIAYVMSRNRKAINWRLVAVGLAMQAFFALFLLRFKLGQDAFQAANDVIDQLLDYSRIGAAFLFRSYLPPKEVAPALVNFAFSVLPTIVFFSSLMAVLYHVGAMQLIIRAIAWAMQKSMRTSGAETLSTAANIFVGQTEAPLLVKPFVATMTKSELLVVMAGGMANTAGGVLAAYVGMLKAFFPDIAGHLLAESIMSAPAALVICKIIWPEDGVPTTLGTSNLAIPKVDSNAVEAAARGASEGFSLAMNVAAMLIAFIALISMLDGLTQWWTGTYALGLMSIGRSWHVRWLYVPLKLFPDGIAFQQVAGWLFIPVAWVMGTPWADCGFVGQLLGQKIVLNEFVAYGTLTEHLTKHHGALSARAVLIATYALSGFANFGSVAIQIGGIGAMAPERRSDIASLGLLAMVAGSFATFMTACFAAALV